VEGGRGDRNGHLQKRGQQDRQKSCGPRRTKGRATGSEAEERGEGEGEKGVKDGNAVKKYFFGGPKTHVRNKNMGRETEARFQKRKGVGPLKIKAYRAVKYREKSASQEVPPIKASRGRDIRGGGGLWGKGYASMRE